MAIQYTPTRPKPPATVPKPKHPGGRPKSASPKVLLTLRLDREVIEAYRSGGKGWQIRMAEVLKAGL